MSGLGSGLQAWKGMHRALRLGFVSGVSVKQGARALDFLGVHIRILDLLVEG